MSERVKRKLSATGSWGSSDQYHDLSPVSDNPPAVEKSAPPPRPPPPATAIKDEPTSVGKSSFFTTLDWQTDSGQRPGDTAGAAVTTDSDNEEDTTDVGMKRRPMEAFQDSFDELVTERAGNKDDSDKNNVHTDKVEGEGLIDDVSDDDACPDGPPGEPVADLLNMGAASADVSSTAQQINLLEMGSAEPSFYDQLIGGPDATPQVAAPTSQNLLGDDFSLFQQAAPPAAAPVQPTDTLGSDANFGGFDAFQGSTGAAPSRVNGSASTGDDIFGFIETKPTGAASTGSMNSLEKDLMSGWNVNHLSASNNIPRISSSQEINHALGGVDGVGMPRNNSVPAGINSTQNAGFGATLNTGFNTTQNSNFGAKQNAGFSSASQNAGAAPQTKPDPFAALGRFLQLINPAHLPHLKAEYVHLSFF